MVQPILSDGRSVVRKCKPRVYVKYFWNDPWVEIPYLYPIRSVREAFPATSMATFQWLFGKIYYFGAEPRIAQQLKLRDYYVKIEIEFINGQRELVWVGIIVDDEVTLKRRSYGVQSINAVGLEHMLDREPIHHAWVNEQGTKYKIGWAPSFNEKNVGRRQDVDVRNKEVSGNRAEGALLFSGSEKETWSLRQMCEYVVLYHKSGGIDWKIAGHVEALEPIEKDVVQQEGMTALEFLRKNISRTRGLGAYVELKDNGPVEIRVFTSTGTNITVGTRTLPANQKQITFTASANWPNTHIFDMGVFRYSIVEQVAEVIVQGQRPVVMGTFRFDRNELKEGFTDNLMRTYAAAGGQGDAQQRDAYRSDERFKRVFTTYLVDPEQVEQLGNAAILLPDSSASKEDGGLRFGPPVTDGVGWTSLGKRFQPLLPIVEGVDYTQNPPTVDNDDSVVPEYSPILVFLQDPEDNQYVKADTMDQKAPGRLHSCSVRPLHDEWGVHVQGSPKHHIGGNPKDGDFIGISQYNWEIDYRTMVVTAAWQADHPYQVSKRNPNPHDTDRKLVITVPDAEYWCAIKSTVIGVKPDGNLATINNDIGGNADHIVLRNDKEKLQAVLAFASAYFFEPRQAISITCNYVSVTEPVSADLGTYIKDIVGLQLQEPVKCVVTSQEIDYRRQQTITKTSYLSLDEMIQAGLGFAVSSPGTTYQTAPRGGRFDFL